MVASLKVRRQKSTSFGSLQQHNAAAVATPPRRGSPRQLRVSQFEYASSLALTELVIDRHHQEVALRQVSSGRGAARRSPRASGGLLRDEWAGAACGSCHLNPVRVVRPLSGRATAGERTWKRESVSAQSCMWDLGRFEARLLGTCCLTPSIVAIPTSDPWGVIF